MKPSSCTTLFVVIVLWTVASFAQLGGNPRFSNLQVHVQVRYADGSHASQGIAVNVEEEGGGLVAQGQTDSQGKANFTVSRPAFYIISVRHAGYESPSPQRVDLNTSSSAFVTFELRPVKGAAAVPPEGPGAKTLSANPAAVKEYQQGEKLLLKEQKSEESIGHFNKAIKLDATLQPAYLLLGMALLDQRKPADAQKVLEKAVQLDPKSAAAHLELGAAYNQQKKFAEAEQELKRGLELNPDAMEGHYEIARSYWAMGNVAEAEAHARKAAEMKSDFPPVHVLLGNVALKKGDRDAAVKEFQEYLRLDPKGPMAQPVQAEIKKLAKAAEAK